jgi:hypothetical protein
MITRSRRFVAHKRHHDFASLRVFDLDQIQSSCLQTTLADASAGVSYEEKSNPIDQEEISPSGWCQLFAKKT